MVLAIVQGGLGDAWGTGLPGGGGVHLEVFVKEEAPVAASGVQQHPRATLLLLQLQPMEQPKGPTKLCRHFM